MKRAVVFSVLMGLCGPGLFAQDAAPKAAAKSSASDAAPPSNLTVGGAVATPLTLSPADLEKMPRTTVKITEDGGEVAYEGVLVAEILKRAGAPGGAKLRGKALATYLLCEAKDGYRVVFALAEFDPDFNDNPAIVADKRDGRALFDYQGPFRILAPRDKRAARSIRMLTKVTVVQVPE